jgi:hypothetical protein
MARNMTFGFPILTMSQVNLADSSVHNTGPSTARRCGLALDAIQMGQLLNCSGRISEINHCSSGRQ